VVVRPDHQVTIQSNGPALNAAAAAAAAAAMTAAGASPGSEAALFPAMPNPTRGATKLGFSLPAGGAITLTIHDLSGRKVRTLVQGGGTPGQFKQTWDLRDDAGREVPVGLYFARLIREGRPSGVQRVVVLR
jgi:flagellar hook assembly protein FlgD